MRETGLEPVRQMHTHLKRACLPVPALAQMNIVIISPDRLFVNKNFGEISLVSKKNILSPLTQGGTMFGVFFS